MVAGGRGHVAVFQVAADARHRLAGQRPGGALADDRGLVLVDSDPVGVVAVGPGAAACDVPPFGALASLPPLPLRLVLGLVTGSGAEHPGDHAAGWGGEVDIPGDGRQVDPAPFGVVDDVLELAGRAGQPVDVPADDRVDEPGLDVLPQPLPRWAGLPAVRRDVVVDVDLGDLPALAVGECSAVLLLPVHAEPGAFTVLGDADVDRCSRHGSHTR